MSTITTTLTFDDLIASYDPELDELEDAYHDVVEFAEDEYGDNMGQWPKSVRAMASMFDQSGKSIQQRRHVLETLRDEYDDGTFTIKMLTGSELIDVETRLRMEAKSRDVEVAELQTYRQQLTADAATVEAPEGVPRDDDDSPLISECPNPLTLAIHEHVERLNTSGSVDFRAPGFGDRTLSADSSSPELPTQSKATSSDTATDAESSTDSGGS